MTRRNGRVAPLVSYHYLVVSRRDPISPDQPSSAIAWVRHAFRSRGFRGALRYYVEGAVELLRGLTPERRKSRYGDIDYDFDHGVDTTWATVSLRTRIRELLSGGQYQPSEPELFHQIMKALPVAADGFTFIDLGSGKGRTLLMASDYQFQRILGVELLAELNQVAQRNIAHYRSDQQRCLAIESQAGDARNFVFPNEPIVLYLFNPFPDYVLRTVLANLRASLPAAPRDVLIVYHNLVHEHVFCEQEWLSPVYRTHQFAIYKAQPSRI